MSATKVIEKSSDKTVLSNRVEYFDSSYGPAGVLAPVLGGLLTWISTAAVTDMFFMDTGAAFGFAGYVAWGSVPAIASVYYASVVSKKMEDYTGVKRSKWDIMKRAVNVVLPVGQKMKFGTQSVALDSHVEPNRLIGGSNSVYSDYRGRISRKNPTHEVGTELVFKPFGSYIKQTVVQSPTKTWDGAFESTVEVHKFKTPPAVNSKPRSTDHCSHH